MEILFLFLFIILFVTELITFIWGIFEIFCDYGEPRDVFRPYMTLYKIFRIDKELNLIGAIIPLIIITPFLIPVIIISLIINFIIFIKTIFVQLYCNIFREKR